MDKFGTPPPPHVLFSSCCFSTTCVEEALVLMKNASNTFPSLIKWLMSAATDEALRVTQFVAAVPAVMDAVSAPLAEHVAQFSVVSIF